MRVTTRLLCSIYFLCFACSAYATEIELVHLQNGYPDLIQGVTSTSILWKDGSHIAVREPLSFTERLSNFFNPLKKVEESISIHDLRCDTYQALFKKMYGHTPREVKQHLVTIYWMPKIFGLRYPLKVTTINGVNKKLERISALLEKLPKSDMKYLDKPGGTFYWRKVKGEPYLSSHSFGIAIDINSHYGNYWLWDFQKFKRPITSDRVNHVPMAIVEIFEHEGFLWGGRWDFYDTMHFEYRPELFAYTKNAEHYYHHQLGMRCPATT